MQWNQCLLNVVANPDYDIVLRGVVIVQNMIQAGKEIAEPIIESQITDCLQAHIARARCKFMKINSFLVQIWRQEGILSIPGIAGYEWVPARIGSFY